MEAVKRSILPEKVGRPTRVRHIGADEAETPSNASSLGVR